MKTIWESLIVSGTLGFHWPGWSSIPGGGTKIPQAERSCQKKKQESYFTCCCIPMHKPEPEAYQALEINTSLMNKQVEEEFKTDIKNAVPQSCEFRWFSGEEGLFSKVLKHGIYKLIQNIAFSLWRNLYIFFS